MLSMARAKKKGHECSEKKLQLPPTPAETVVFFFVGFTSLRPQMQPIFVALGPKVRITILPDFRRVGGRLRRAPLDLQLQHESFELQ